MVCQCELFTIFESWAGLSGYLKNGMVWKMVFYAITQTIWLARNDVAFKGKELDGIQIFELVKTRMAWWINAKWPNLMSQLGTQ